MNVDEAPKRQQASNRLIQRTQQKQQKTLPGEPGKVISPLYVFARHCWSREPLNMFAEHLEDKMMKKIWSASQDVLGIFKCLFKCRLLQLRTWWRRRRWWWRAWTAAYCFSPVLSARSQIKLRCNCLSLLNTTHSSGTHSFILNTLCYHIWQIDNFKSPLLYTESCKIIPQTFLNNNQTGCGHHLTRHLKAQPFKATKTSRRLINREPDTKVRRLTHRFAHLLFGNVNLAQEVPLKQKLAEPKANNSSPLNSGPTVFLMLLGSTLTRLSFQTV